MNARAYPLPRPNDDDPRFTIGLHLDVAKVLTDRGFPKLSGVDLVDLGMALFGFVYASEARPVPPIENDSSLTLAEYRDALAFWENRAAEAQVAGNQNAVAYRTQGAEALRKTIRRLEGGTETGDGAL